MTEEILQPTEGTNSEQPVVNQEVTTETPDIETKQQWKEKQSSYLKKINLQEQEIAKLKAKNDPQEESTQQNVDVDLIKQQVRAEMEATQAEKQIHELYGEDGVNAFKAEVASGLPIDKAVKIVRADL